MKSGIIVVGADDHHDAGAIAIVCRSAQAVQIGYAGSAGGDDNWGNWEIEDATIYHGVWLYALLGYADVLGKIDELFQTPEIYYYSQYFLH